MSNAKVPGKRMLSLILCIVLSQFPFFSTSAYGAVPASPTNLAVADYYDQTGIDTSAPAFQWVVNDSDRGEKQTAYQLIVSSSQANSDINVGDMWDSGKVTSSQQYGVAYNGASLANNAKYWWKVKTWDKDGNVSAWSASATFLTGHINGTGWTASWIKKSDDGGTVPAYLRKAFTIGKTVQFATANISGLGQFELYLNGGKVGDHEFDPGWTKYDQSQQYVTFDVTGMLRSGDNAIGVILADGFYNTYGNGSRYTKFQGAYGQKIMKMELNIQYTDGTSTKVVSDTSWKASTGPITFSHIFAGEDYDARKEKTGWNSYGYDDSSWANAVAAAAPGGALTAQKQPPIKIMNTYSTVNVTNLGSNKYVYDLGINFSGVYEIAVSGTAGQTIKISPAENVNSDGTVNQASIGGTIYSSYTLKGGGTEVWRPHFFYTGVRYVQIEGMSNTPGAGLPYVSNVKGYYLHSSAEQIGTFNSSNSYYNAIHKMVLQSYMSNLQSVFTDCPGREKLGWQEQSYLQFPGYAYNFNIQSLWTKMAKDQTESQLSSGLSPAIAPELTVFSGDFRDSASWGIASVLDPWYLYQTYGDLSVLSRQYATMKNDVQYLRGKAVGNIVQTGLGDWGGIETWNSQLVETASYYYAVKTLAQAAAVLGNTADVTDYTNLANQIQSAFNSNFLDASGTKYNPVTQTSQAMPIYMNLVPASNAASVFNTLLSDITAHSQHLQTGDIGNRYLFQVLADKGYNDLLDQMFLSPTQPSYRYLVDIGKTSLPEYWDGSNSQQHAMMGPVEEWLYGSLAGIKSAKPGYEEIQIKPTVVGSVTSASASVRTIRGTVSSSWSTSGNTLTENVTIPVNSTAKVYLPAKGYSNVTIQEGSNTIYSNNAPQGSVSGISFNAVQGDYYVFNVGSGTYSFSITGTAVPANLAAGATVTASSSLSGYGWDTTKVNDGQDGSTAASMGWSSLNTLTASHTEWLQLDLGSSKPITEVDLYPRNDAGNVGYGFPIDFTIDVSSDNVNWTNAVSRTGFVLPGDGGQKFSFTAQNARYVKITGTKLRSNPTDSNSYRMQFAEVKIMNQMIGTNKAMLAVPSASSTYSGSGWDLTKVNDAQLDSTSGSMGWTSDNNLTANHTEWIVMDLGSSASVSEVDLFPRNDAGNAGYGFPLDFTIQLSADNSTWTTVVTKTAYALPGNAGQKFVFTPQTARYIKVQGTSLRSNPNESNRYRLQFAEIQVY